MDVLTIGSYILVGIVIVTLVGQVMGSTYKG